MTTEISAQQLVIEAEGVLHDARTRDRWIPLTLEQDLERAEYAGPRVLEAYHQIGKTGNAELLARIYYLARDLVDDRGVRGELLKNLKVIVQEGQELGVSTEVSQEDDCKPDVCFRLVTLLSVLRSLTQSGDAVHRCALTALSRSPTAKTIVQIAVTSSSVRLIAQMRLF